MKKKSTLTLIILMLLLIILILIFSNLKPTGYIVKEQKEQVKFYFYDEITNCSLDGYVFIGENLIGKTELGTFKLTKENYQENFNLEHDISLFGRLGTCFNKNSNLFFDKYWESFEIEDYYFDGDSIFNFKTRINPNNPAKRELIGFIQPEKVKERLDNINLDDKNTLNSLSSINNYLNNKINYKEDWKFNKTNYWQTPNETLEIEQGDCEDYSTTLLSLFLAYNPSLNCYNIIFTSHVTTFCHIDEYYIYYDQEKTELKKQISKISPEETKNNLKKLKQDYFEYYGIENNETKAHFAFNDNKYIEFANEDNFINWQYALYKKQEFDLFENLESKSIRTQQKYPLEELATEKPTTTSELPTEKSFPYLTISLLTILFLILLIILIKINKKKPQINNSQKHIH